MLYAFAAMPYGFAAMPYAFAAVPYGFAKLPMCNGGVRLSIAAFGIHAHVIYPASIFHGSWFSLCFL